MNSKLKAAIIGYGYMGEIRHRMVDQHLSNIFSLKIDVPSLDKKSAFTLLETPEDIESYSLKLKQCFDACIGICSGYSERYKGFWSKKLSAHYYKGYYSYCVVMIEVEEKLDVQAYALVGQTSFNDGIERLDILELVVPEDERVRDLFLKAVLSYGNQLHCQELRVQLTEHDPLVRWFKKLGFVLRWQTNLLGKYFDSDRQFPDENWKFFHVDYI